MCLIGVPNLKEIDLQKEWLKVTFVKWYEEEEKVKKMG